MVTFDGRSYETCHIIIPKIDIIDKDVSYYNCQSLDLMNKRSFVGNGEFFYFNDDGKIEIFRIPKK